MASSSNGQSQGARTDIAAATGCALASHPHRTSFGNWGYPCQWNRPTTDAIDCMSVFRGCAGMGGTTRATRVAPISDASFTVVASSAIARL
ncbi:MAG: hypothetical protein V7L01_28915 [Nostoc sp.]|uniref:hypothetical protein n=1 Tax=Nostoc sp. TaxID=1180 RepID=UPI002FF8FC31